MTEDQSKSNLNNPRSVRRIARERLKELESPSKEEIAMATAEIRLGWSDDTYRRRGGETPDFVVDELRIFLSRSILDGA